jgi:hypothetical protein
VLNAIQRMRWRRRERAAKAAWLACRDEPAFDWETTAARAMEHMAEFDRAAAVFGPLRARLAEDEVRAGPLLTDGWSLAPRMAGIGRRLGSLTAGELEAEQ